MISVEEIRIKSIVRHILLWKSVFPAEKSDKPSSSPLQILFFYVSYMDIAGKIIVITGASQGIGKATAQHLANQGGRIVLASRSAEKLREIEAELPGTWSVPTDMREVRDVRNLVEKTVQQYGRIDILINNAGQGLWTTVEAMDIDDYRAVWELNVLGALQAMQAVIPVMRRQGGGMIVNVSSMVSRNYYPNLAGYASTKYALNALSLTARTELEKDGIIVSLIRPKLVATDFGKNSAKAEPDFLRERDNTSAPPIDTPEFVAEQIAELIRSEAAELDLG